jgi:hypothetical protein
MCVSSTTGPGNVHWPVGVNPELCQGRLNSRQCTQRTESGVLGGCENTGTGPIDAAGMELNSYCDAAHFME